MKKIKSILLLTLMTFGYSVFGCWYQKSYYTDYIYSINDNVMITTNIVNNVMQYTVKNNCTVDLPLTVSMKLISDEVIDIGEGQTSTIGNITGKLQYRVLPNGKWVTVSDYTVESGKISKDSKPSTYFGTYNIWPRNLKAGDVIMVRLYVTDGMWQSGEIVNLCSDKLTDITTTAGTKKALPNTFTYNIESSSLLTVDLGGSWSPHLAMTVVYSGNERPLK